MDKKAAILSAALNLLAQKGVHATPMSAIAKEANTGMGTIYNYFPNKEVLINALYVHIKNAEKEVFTAFNNSKPLKTQFEEYYYCGIQFYIDNPSYFQFIEQLQASPIITEESRAMGYEAINAVLELIEKGKEERVIKNISTNELIQFIGGTMIAYLRTHFQGNQRKDPVIGNQLKMTWDAIKE